MHAVLADNMVAQTKFHSANASVRHQSAARLIQACMRLLRGAALRSGCGCTVHGQHGHVIKLDRSNSMLQDGRLYALDRHGRRLISRRQ